MEDINMKTVVINY